jgi:hypothetical protein
MSPNGTAPLLNEETHMQRKVLIIGAIAGSAALIAGALTASAHGPGRGGMQAENHGKAVHGEGKMHRHGHKHASGHKGKSHESPRGPAATQHNH